MKTSLPDEEKTMIQQRVYEEDVSRTFRAHIGHLSRTFPAILKRERCLTGVQNVPDMGGVSTSCMEIASW